jgi:hypothetical protein
MALNNSFTEILKKMEDVLPADPDVASFCNEKYGKGLTVRRTVRRVDELPPEDFPLVMLSRPRQKMDNKPGMMGRVAHQVLLYIVLHQDEMDLALDEVIQIEELIDQALLRNNTLGGLAVDIDTSDGSENSEHAWHPDYAIVKGIKVVQEVNQLRR